ncbi:hypothetical protein M422DRAFT_778803 [Sphaerobolus stellatus SS14]|uniref:Zinc finger CHCC-type domain-containing protein n=1 Tax=Sphaerobolus stellatus (strain SS14) TaxID=990650 RepID=A0A0C9URU1_SPHS4|nr:hypothetical protein M422DRAFT_778803 [Sphaerobolus stellatus SS14]
MLRRVVLRSPLAKVQFRSNSNHANIPPPSYSQLQSSSPIISPDSVPKDAVPQAPNYAKTWSTSQRPRPIGKSEARFEQTDMSLQPQPLSAMEMINNEPIRLVEGRRAVCDGGGGPLGHPKIYINLDKPGPRPCGVMAPFLPDIGTYTSRTAAFDSSKTTTIINKVNFNRSRNVHSHRYVVLHWGSKFIRDTRL